jgi:hypothetical protein
LCYFKQELFPESSLYNGQLLDVDPKNLKGRYRGIQLSYLEEGVQGKEKALSTLNQEMKGPDAESFKTLMSWIA